MKKTIVLYPGLAVGHFVPMMQLADVLLEQGFAVTVALIDVTFERYHALAASVRRVASSKPLVTFHTLPRIKDPPALPLDVNLLVGYFELMRRYNEHFHDFLCSLPPRSVHAVIVDTLSTEALNVVKQLGIPAYTFFTTNASALAVFLQLPSFRSEDQPSFKELGDTPLEFLGVPPMPASHLIIEVLQDPNSEVYKAMMRSYQQNAEPDGILLNTIKSLEPRAVAALRDTIRFLPKTMPPVYCVGPLVEGSADDASSNKEKHECLRWLDQQPEGSVVFLCFGSVGASNHSKDQLNEIAIGLEKSDHRFLWVVRRAPPDQDDPVNSFDPCADPDLDVLPEGFLERTTGRGFVVKLWAPQVDVLHHKATAAFVTHCGWNSVLEGIMAGVPMICWPLYAEQMMNKVFMVQEFGIGVEMDGNQHGLVKAEEVEAKVRLVMESSEEGERLRARVKEHRAAAAMAWKDGGSSQVAFSRFLSDAAGQQHRFGGSDASLSLV